MRLLINQSFIQPGKGRRQWYSRCRTSGRVQQKDKPSRQRWRWWGVPPLAHDWWIWWRKNRQNRSKDQSEYHQGRRWKRRRRPGNTDLRGGEWEIESERSFIRHKDRMAWMLVTRIETIKGNCDWRLVRELPFPTFGKGYAIWAWRIKGYSKKLWVELFLRLFVVCCSLKSHQLISETMWNKIQNTVTELCDACCLAGPHFKPIHAIMSSFHERVNPCARKHAFILANTRKHKQTRAAGDSESIPLWELESEGNKHLAPPIAKLTRATKYIWSGF